MHGTENATGPTVRPNIPQPGSTLEHQTSQTSNDTQNPRIEIHKSQFYQLVVSQVIGGPPKMVGLFLKKMLIING